MDSFLPITNDDKPDTTKQENTIISTTRRKQIEQLETLLEKGQYDQAMTLVKLIKKELQQGEGTNDALPMKIMVKLVEASILIDQGYYSKAKAVLDHVSRELEILKTQPASTPKESETVNVLMTDLLLTQLTVSLQLSDYKRASSLQANIRQSLKKMPKRDKLKRIIKFQYLVGLHQWLKGNLDEALTTFMDILPEARATSNIVMTAKILNEIGAVLADKGELQRALEVLEESRALIKSLGNMKEMASVLMTIGTVYHDMGKLNKALEYYEQSLKIWSRFGTKKDIGTCLNNIGIVFHDKGLLEEALQYYEQSLQLWQEIGNEQDIGTCLNNIGLLYHDMGQLNKALEYHEKCLQLWQEIGNEQDVATCLNNIGLNYLLKGDLDKAQEYYEKALSLWTKINNEQDVAEALYNLGQLQQLRGNLSIALKYHERSLEIWSNVGNEMEMGKIYNAIGSIYRLHGDFNKSKECFSKSLEIFSRNENLIFHSEALFQLGILFWSQNNNKDAKKFLEQCLEKRKRIGNPIGIAETLFYLMNIALESNEWKLAEQQLIKLENQAGNTNCKYVKHVLLVARALFSLSRHNIEKRSNRMNRVRAEYHLWSVIDDTVANQDVTMNAILLLCGLYLDELRKHDDEELLQLLHELTKRIRTIAFLHMKSASLMAQAFWLEAKISFIEGNYKKGREYFQRALQIAEEKGLEKLSIRISEDYDASLPTFNGQTLPSKESRTVQHVIETKQLVKQIYKEQVTIQPPRQAREQPLLVLIAIESGLLLYTHNFTDEMNANPLLISNFVSAIQAFSRELFEQELEAIKIGEYILTFSTIQPLIFAYISKHGSLNALKKIQTFTKNLQENQNLRDQLIRLGKKGLHLPQDLQKILHELSEQIFLFPFKKAKNSSTIPIR